MSYDPNFPPHGAELISADFRNQFHGIKDLIDAGVPGLQGPQGDPGPPGSQGPQGAQGPAGDVSAQQLADGLAATLTTAAANSSANSNGVSALGLTVSDPPTQAEVQAVADKLDALITALRR